MVDDEGPVAGSRSRWRRLIPLVALLSVLVATARVGIVVSLLAWSTALVCGFVATVDARRVFLATPPHERSRRRVTIIQSPAALVAVGALAAGLAVLPVWPGLLLPVGGVVVLSVVALVMLRVRAGRQ